MKQFGKLAERVTTEEMRRIHEELNEKVGKSLCGFELTLTLEEKQDHGDIDILVLLHPDQEIKSIIKSLNPLAVNKNGYCYSFLYRSNIGKVVHVDFLVASEPNNYMVKKQYYAFNDLSATIGIMAKTKNFKYSSEGFFKRYEDKRGNWHDILVSINLNPGLQCLGLEPKPLWLRTYQDVVDYVSASLFFDSSMYAFSLDDNEDNGRKQLDIWRALAKLEKKAVIKDEDYFLKRLFPAQYSEVLDRIKEIEAKAYAQSRYNGKWLMDNFGLKQGPLVGKLLKLISDSFGDLLGEVEEELVLVFVKEQIDGKENL
jgi:hypothetical protein